MISLTVNASTEYDIHIGCGLLEKSGKYIASLPDVRRVMVVTDDTVNGLYGSYFVDSLRSAGIDFDCFSFAPGEASKRPETVIALLSELARKGYTRTDLIAALGGGVVGDIAGFTAAIYLRGIRYIGIPTTLLACVDSSVGGKTGVDLDEGKNLAGAFHNPSLVLCDPDTLLTLPAEVFSDGMAEVVKYGVICDRELFEMPEAADRGGIKPDMNSIIARCIAAKKKYVEADERDRGVRRLLNFGHTAGHAIEACSDYTMCHGHAVAAGMMTAARYAQKLGLCSTALVCRLERMLTGYGLPTESPYDPSRLLETALRDKKRGGDIIDLILPREIGNCEIFPTPIGELSVFLAESVNRKPRAGDTP
ncbi:MAG: 3-dehydroquinate synthase [Clostridiales bacterium]|nr:3-dehydroquinate synthase [Clostridiales bacterium]